MKKIITFLLIALFTFNLSAQKIEKGIWQIEIGSGIDANYNWITGGDWKTETKLNGSSISDNDGNWNDIYDSQTNLNYDLDFTNFSDWESRFLDGISFGYFIADGLLIGLGLDLNGLNIRDNYNSDPFENDKVKWNEFKIGAIPKIRYYLPTGRGNAMFFEGSFGMGINNRNASVEGRLIPVGSDPWDYDVIAYDPITGTGISAQADEKDTWDSKRNIFSSSIGLGVGYSAFLFNSREIFSIEPQIGLNINSRNRLSETTTFDESSDDTIVISSEDKISNIGVFLKLKLSFYLGRHFWSH
jgi:hypothetical protein